jgi:hypothetical protein
MGTGDVRANIWNSTHGTTSTIVLDICSILLPTIHANSCIKITTELLPHIITSTLPQNDINNYLTSSHLDGYPSPPANSPICKARDYKPLQAF